MTNTRHARLPEPVYDAAKEEAEERDISIGAVVGRWYSQAQIVERALQISDMDRDKLTALEEL